MPTPTLEEARRSIQKIIHQYDAEKGLGRKLSIFKPSYSPFMQALVDWHRKEESLIDLKKIMDEHYRAYFHFGNFIRGEERKYGRDLSFKCLVACDNDVFEGGVCSDILSKEIQTIRRSLYDLHTIDLIAKRGLLHFLPDNFFETLKESDFFITKYTDTGGLLIDNNTSLAWAIANGANQTAKKLILFAPLEALMVKDGFGGKGILALLVAKGSGYRPDPSQTKHKEGSVKEVFDTLMSRQDLTPELINQKDRYGNTPLHIAFLRRDRHMIKALLEKGADISITNESGLTPIEYYESMTPREAYNAINKNYFGGKAELGFLDDILAKRVPDDDLSDLIRSLSRGLGSGF